MRVSSPFVIWMSFENCLSCPLVMGLGSFSLLLFSSYGFEHHHIIFFYAQNFWSFEFFFIPPRFVRAPLMSENFLLCPPVLLRHFQSLSFFLCLLHLPPVWGVILAKVIFLRKALGSKGDCKWYILDSWKDYQRCPFFISNSCI